ncbi:MAG: c-type cytochrome [Gemmatimonadota bacterium]
MLLLLLAGCHEGSPSGGISPRERVLAGNAEAGPALIDRYGCGGCHVIPGVREAVGHVGPPLTDWALRGYIAGNLRNEPEQLVRWIRDPQAIEPGTVMPNLGVSDAEARHIAAYLYTLGDPTRLGPPHPFPTGWLHRLSGGGESHASP